MDRSDWLHEVAPGDGLRARVERGYWSLAAQREPWHWSWPRALAGFTAACALLLAFTVALDGQPGALVGGAAAFAWAVASARRMHLRYLARQAGEPEPRRWTGLRVAVAAAAAVAFVAVVVAAGVGAGSEREERRERVARSLGGQDVSEADEARLQRWFETAEPFGTRYAELLGLLDDAQATTDRHRAAVDGVSALVDRMLAASRGFDDADVERTLTGYVARLDAVVAAIDRVVALDEREGETDEEVEAALADLQRESEAAERAERAFLDRLAAELPADEREQLLEAYRQRLEEFDEQAGR